MAIPVATKRNEMTSGFHELFCVYELGDASFSIASPNTIGVTSGVSSGSSVGVGVGIFVTVGVGVLLGVGVFVGVDVAVGVAVACGVGVDVGVGSGSLNETVTLLLDQFTEDKLPPVVV